MACPLFVFVELRRVGSLLLISCSLLRDTMLPSVSLASLSVLFFIMWSCINTLTGHLPFQIRHGYNKPCLLLSSQSQALIPVSRSGSPNKWKPEVEFRRILRLS